MRVLRKIALTGRTVICTIHQPSYELFALFDDLLLLQRGGHQVCIVSNAELFHYLLPCTKSHLPHFYQVYFGPVGQKCRSIVEYLEQFHAVERCPLGTNPASWMLDVLASAFAKPSSQQCKATAPCMILPDFPSNDIPTGPEFQTTYFSSPLWCQDGVGLLARLSCLCEREVPLGKTTISSRASLSLFVQYAVLAAREWRTAYRDLPYNMGRILALLGLQVFYGIVYIGIYSKATDVAGLQSLVSAIFNTTAYAVRLHLPLIILHSAFDFKLVFAPTFHFTHSRDSFT